MRCVNLQGTGNENRKAHFLTKYAFNSNLT